MCGICACGGGVCGICACGGECVAYVLVVVCGICACGGECVAYVLALSTPLWTNSSNWSCFRM